MPRQPFIAGLVAIVGRSAVMCTRTPVGPNGTERGFDLGEVRPRPLFFQALCLSSGRFFKPAYPPARSSLCKPRIPA